MPDDWKILLASRNPGKVRELRSVLGELGVRVVGLEDLDPRGAIAPPPEEADTFAENARRKAEYYARATGMPALADDSGLQVDALGGAPGTRSARYASGDSPPQADRARRDAANNARLLGALAGVPDDRRTARFVCHLALSDGSGTLIEAWGTVQGRIAPAPAGQNGFGYDPLFFLPELGCTLASLPAERKNAISHRGQATRRFVEELRRFLGERTGQRPCRP